MNKFDDAHNMHYDATSIVTSFSAMLLIAVSFSRCYLAPYVRHLHKIKKMWLNMSRFLITQIVGLRLVNRIY